MHALINLFKRKEIASPSECSHPGLAALLIDMQTGNLVKRDFDPLDKKTIVDAQIEMIKYLSKENIPIIDINMGRGRTIKPLREQLKNAHSLYFQKQHLNAFRYGTCKKGAFTTSFVDNYLTDILRRMEVEHVLLMGVYASVCVYSTARGAVLNGFDVSIADDLIADTLHRKKQYTHKRKDDYLALGAKYYDNHHDFIGSLKGKTN